MANASKRWTVARAGSLGLALLPLAALALLAANLVVMSWPALEQVGLFGGTLCPAGIISLKFCNVFSGTCPNGNSCQYGLLVPLWGTFIATALALALALPASLAIAVFASEYSLGGVGRIMEVILGLLGGIPPVVYGLLSVTVMLQFMQPKLGGRGLEADIIRHLPGLPYDLARDRPVSLPTEASTLLGGVMLSLLVIPFMAPLILDAIRNVPPSLKEASLGLGATRWYTLVHVTLPGAFPSIVPAISLGILKTVGDVAVGAWTLGMVTGRIPDPLWDLFQPVAPLTTSAAGLLGGIGVSRSGLDLNMAYLMGLVLMVFVAVVLGLTEWLQRSWRRRLAA